MTIELINYSLKYVILNEMEFFSRGDTRKSYLVHNMYASFCHCSFMMLQITYIALILPTIMIINKPFQWYLFFIYSFII